MSVVIWIVVIACITAVTMTSIICSARIEESKYEAFARTMNNPWINNKTTTEELKKMVEKINGRNQQNERGNKNGRADTL